MTALINTYGHKKLKLSFEPYIFMAANGEAKLSDITERLGISRQAANQVAKQIEAAGYIKRSEDPLDKRSKRIALTKKAKQLIHDGAIETGKQQSLFADIIGQKSLKNITQLVEKLNIKLGLLTSFKPPSGIPSPLAATLPRLSEYINQRLREITKSKGHPDLKPRYGSVLKNIGPLGGHIQTMAREQGVSKQAISLIASELEQLGYIERQSDPLDPRQHVFFSQQPGIA
ncbi:MarR family transcriptional regulator [Oceanicoccus sp. KOV_DT_Chl]|uniref:MarR family transcriptional regulator n=1 Tax=Oceanicoccus sp. KOV_DT_Chl TaxID=1904639 RepID=UPI000C7D5D92|nr:MarR family transcriptional regulator [Oceanicoccus sp. KOV_DT_Chl]